ncbi:MAG: branched-chain amino acid ABC transporter permease [Synergistaceae bacterium]|nr:branched-chain amino acid ABC transporter permease [Synergistaceae bacterium]
MPEFLQQIVNNFSWTTFTQQIINGLSFGSVYALIAVGYSLVYSILGFSNFAHGGFIVVGAYTCYLIMGELISSSTYLPWQLGAGIALLIGGVAAIVFSGIVGVITERMAYKPIREKTSLTLYLLIASMGVSIVIENLFVVTIGGRFRALPQVNLDIPWLMRLLGLPPEPIPLQHTIKLAEGITISTFDIITFVVAFMFLLGLQLFLQRTKWGLAIRAAACDLRTAGLMGVNVGRLISIIFLVAGGLAGVCGIFLGMRYTIYPQLGDITFKAFVAAVVGGLGSLPGAVVGSIILGLLEMLVAGFISSQLRDLVVYSLLVITLIVKPTGLFGKQIGDKV